MTDHPQQPMHGDQDSADNSLMRLKTIEGHIRGIQRMVEDGTSSIDIMRQIKAVKQALEKVNAIALQTHLDLCIKHGLMTDDKKAKERAFQEIKDAFNVIGKL